MSRYTYFWSQHPALLYGISLLLGTYIALIPSVELAIPVIALFATLVGSPQRLILASAVFAVSACGNLCYFSQKTPLEGVFDGTGYFLPAQIVKTHTGQTVWKGRVWSLIVAESGERIVSRSAMLKFAKGATIPRADRLFKVEARWQLRGQGRLIGTVEPSAQLQKIAWIPSFAEVRSHLKGAVGDSIDRYFAHPHVRAFMKGMATGSHDDRQLSYVLGELGLQHLLAISGFHFAIVASALQLFLGLFVPPPRLAHCTLIVLSLYFFYLGWGASVGRAWVMAIVALGARILHRHDNRLNALGVALIVIGLFDPLMVLQLDFQMSFLATGGILLLMEPCQWALAYLFPDRPRDEVRQLTFFDQHLYLLLKAFREAVALLGAVHLPLLPLCFYHFGLFPLIALWLNLFFPLCVTIAIWGGLLSLFAWGVSESIANWGFASVDYALNWLLSGLFFIPPQWQVWMRCQLPLGVLLVVLVGVFLVGAWRCAERRDESWGLLI